LESKKNDLEKSVRHEKTVKKKRGGMGGKGGVAGDIDRVPSFSVRVLRGDRWKGETPQQPRPERKKGRDLGPSIQ